MTDPYTEATRHERRRLPTFAKVILVAGGLFAATLVTAAVVGMIFARKAFEEFETPPAEAFADLETLADLAEVLGAEADVFASDLEWTRGDLEQLVIALQDARNGSDIDIDLADIAEWVSELETLIEEAVEEGVRIEGRAHGSGGRITLSGRDGRTVFEMRGDEKGGVLKIHGPGTDTRIGLGDDAAEIPEWVSVFPDARVARHLLSGDSRKGSFGAVALKADADARSVYDWYRDNLPGAGLGMSMSRMQWDHRRERGEIHARSDGLARERELFVLVWENDEGGTSLFLMHKVDR